MVGGTSGQGKKALGLTSYNFPIAKPFVTYKNGKWKKQGYDPNQ